MQVYPVIKIHKIFGALIIIATVGCNEGYRYIAPPEPENLPVITNELDSLTLVVDARNLLHSVDRAVSFSGAKLAVTYNVSGYRGGRCIIGIRDSVGVLVRLDTLTSDTSMISTRPVSFKPRFVSALFEGFTGTVSFSVRNADVLPPFTIAQFPYRQGASWRYAVQRFGSSDTVLVQSVRDVIVGGNTISRWLFTQTSTSDSLSVYQFGDSLQMSNRFFNRLGFFLMVFPLVPGKQWHVFEPDYEESSVVPAIESTSIPARANTICYVVEQEWWDGARTGNTTSWLLPGVGIAKQRIHTGREFEEWVLIDYSIP